MFGVLGARAAWEAMQPRRKKCGRCGLYYRESLEKCRWCGDLDENGLAELKARLDREHRGNKSLGHLFFLIAVACAVVVLLI
ncbi:MAG: hypothetical protein AAGA95_08310 [Pseudomonadota bacterium]